MAQQKSDQARFVIASLNDAERLWHGMGGKEVDYEMAGGLLRVRFVNGSCHDLMQPALAHSMLETQAPAADNTIYVIDSHCCNFDAPPENWPFEVNETQDHQRVCWRPQEGISFTSDESRGIWHLHDFHRKRGLYWIRSVHNLPFWEAGSPLRHSIHWTTLSLNRAMIHAAAVGTQTRGFLLTGAGGSGKSTTTAAAIEKGWQTTGDDFVLVSSNGDVTAHPIFDVMKLNAMSMEWFPHLASEISMPSSETHEKSLIPLTKAAGSQFVTNLPIHALMCLELTGLDTSSFEPASKRKAVAALAPSTMNILRTAMPETLAACSAIVRSLPTFTFKVGRDPSEAVAALTEFANQDGDQWQQHQK